MPINVEDVMKTATEALQSARSAHKRIDTLETEVKDVHALANAVGRLDEKVSGMRDDITELKGDIGKLTGEPAERWNTVVRTALTALISALVGAVIGLFLK